MPSLAICAPAVRIMVVNAILDEDNPESAPTIEMNPVVAIRTSAGRDGSPGEDMLVLVDDQIRELFGFFDDNEAFNWKVVYCPWPASEDEARLGRIGADLAGELLAGIQMSK